MADLTFNVTIKDGTTPDTNYVKRVKDTIDTVEPLVPPETYRDRLDNMCRGDLADWLKRNEGSVIKKASGEKLRQDLSAIVVDKAKMFG